MTSERLNYRRLSDAAASLGLACRGGFSPEPEDGVPDAGQDRPTRTLVLLGFTGASQWPVFASSVEYRDGRPNPLNRWSQRVISELGVQFGATDLYPWTGPPWWPFQRWAKRAERLHASPLGILIHPRFGLWHAYRGALAFEEEFQVPGPIELPHPCDQCAAKPCIASCPARAVSPAGFDRPACATHLSSPEGIECTSGCLARRACPVGASYRYGADQSAFHMQSLLLEYGITQSRRR